MLARRKIGWLGNRGADIPESVAAETDGPGDDIGIELSESQTRLEVQVKRGIAGKAKLTGALRTFIDKLSPSDPIEGVLVVDPQTPAAITRDLREDLGRIRDGRRDNLREMASAVLEALTRAQAPHVAERLEVVPVAVDHRSDPDRKFAVTLLMQLLGDEDLAEQAFDVLVTEGHQLIRHKGRRTRQALEATLRSKGWRLGAIGGPGSIGDLAERLTVNTAADARTASGAAVAAGVTRDAELSSSSGSAELPAADAPWNAEIDRARDMLRGGHPGSALTLLRALERDMREATGLGVDPPTVRGDAKRGSAPADLSGKTAKSTIPLPPSSQSPISPTHVASDGTPSTYTRGVGSAPVGTKQPASIAPATWHRLYANLGAALFRLGRYAESRALFEEARQYIPEHAGTLTNLARVAYLLEDRIAAERLAWRAVGANANEAGAWALLAEVGAIEADVTDTDATFGRADRPPTGVRSSPEFRIGVAAAAKQRGDDATAADLLRSTLTDERPPDRLYLLAHTLLAATETPMRLIGPPDPRLQEIEALASEALARLPNDEFSTLLEEVLLLRGTVRRLRGALDDAADDARRAFQLHPEATAGRWRSACLYAAVKLDQEQPDDVLGVLNLVAPADRPAQLHVIRARAFAALHRQDDVRRAIDDAFAAAERASDGVPSDPNRQARSEMALACVEIALDAGLVALAAELFEANVGREVGWLWTLFAGRIAIARGDDEGGLTHLHAAAQQADDAARPRIYFEMASRLAQLGRFSETVEAYETGGAWAFGDAVRPGYVAALIESGRQDRAGALLESLEDELRPSESQLPAWALPAAAAIAERRADLHAAAEHLARLVALRPESVNAHLRLAHVYMRLGDLDAAAPVVRALVGRRELDSHDRMILASLLFTIGDHALAIREAYHALRAADVAVNARQIEQGYRHLLLQAERVGALEPPKAVGPDVRVTLRRTEGKGRRLIEVLGEGPADAARAQFVAGDPAIAPLIGLALGAEVHLLGRKVFSKPSNTSEDLRRPLNYRIVAIESLPGLAYGNLMKELVSSAPPDSGVRALSLGEEGTVGYLMPLLRELHSMAAGERKVFAVYDEHAGLLPLGAIARLLNRSLHEAYILCVQRAAGRLHTEFGGGDALEQGIASAGDTTPLVLTRSALTTAQLLEPYGVDLLALVERLGRQILVPQSLLDELEEERRELQLSTRDGTTRIAPGPAGFATSETTPEQTARHEKQLLDLIAWVRRVAAIPVRSLAALSSDTARLIEVIGASSVDALDAAGSRGATLYADDLGLRRFENALVVGVRSCSSWALISSAQQRGLLKSREARRAIAALVEMQHYFVPLSGELLAGLVHDEAHQITPLTRLVFRRLADPAIDVNTAVDVAAQTLQRVALAGIGASALGDVTQACLLELTERRSLARVLNPLARRVGVLFRFLHEHRQEVLDRIAQFKVTKRIAGSLL
jgi:tetratricopeptide (TPR) repeat protein